MIFVPDDVAKAKDATLRERNIPLKRRDQYHLAIVMYPGHMQQRHFLLLRDDTLEAIKIAMAAEQRVEDKCVVDVFLCNDPLGTYAAGPTNVPVCQSRIRDGQALWIGYTLMKDEKRDITYWRKEAFQTPDNKDCCVCGKKDANWTTTHNGREMHLFTDKSPQCICKACLADVLRDVKKGANVSCSYCQIKNEDFEIRYDVQLQVHRVQCIGKCKGKFVSINCDDCGAHLPPDVICYCKPKVCCCSEIYNVCMSCCKK